MARVSPKTGFTREEGGECVKNSGGDYDSYRNSGQAELRQRHGPESRADRGLIRPLRGDKIGSFQGAARG